MKKSRRTEKLRRIFKHTNIIQIIEAQNIRQINYVIKMIENGLLKTGV